MTIAHTALTSTTQATTALAVNTAVSNMVTAITTHPGWTLYDSRTNLGSGAWNYWVLKNSSAYSGLPLDYYVIIAQSGTTALATVSEAYVGTTAATAVQTVTITGSPTGGTYTLKATSRTGSVSTSGTIAFNASAATLQTTLTGLATIGAGNATVTGSNGGPYTVTFGGTLANSYIPQLQLVTNSLTGGTSPSVAVADSTVGVFACEAYYMTQAGGNAGTMVLDSSARVPFPANMIGADPATGALSVWGSGNAINFLSGYGQFNTNVQSLAATTVFYTVTAYDDHLVFAFGTSAITVRYWYYGAATSLYASSATSDPVVLVTQNLSPASTTTFQASGGYTRMPASYASTTQANWVFTTLAAASGSYTHVGQVENQLANPSSTLSQTAPFLDVSQSNYQVSRFLLPLADPTVTGNTNSTVSISLRCALNNAVTSFNVPSGMALGDTIAFNGTYWQFLGGLSGTTQAAPYLYGDTGVAV